MDRKRLADILRGEGIGLFATLGIHECRVTKKYLLDRLETEPRSVIIMAVPYASRDVGVGNVSEYAKPRDYHLFWKELFGRLIPRLEVEFDRCRFMGFADHSPIDERHAAALGGLGIIGRNGLLITEKHSSFVFLGEIITDAEFDSDAAEIGYCEDCGRCRVACPVAFSGDCLSSLTQKKGELEDDERRAVKALGSVWGCDRCQMCCPHTEAAIAKGTLFTDIPFFLGDRLPTVTHRLISEMSDEEFSRRAYSWRGRPTILRNLALAEEDGDTE